MKGPKTEALNLLWGSILTLSRTDLYLLSAATAAVGLFSGLFYQNLRAIVFDRMIARSTGIPDRALFYLLLFVCGATITLNLNTIGGLLIFSLIVNPPSAAYRLTHHLGTMIALSAAFGVLSCLAGLALSYSLDVPTGAVIVLVSGLILLLSMLAAPRTRPRSAGA
jgi:manganese/iron transport system permease protein